MTSKNPFDIVSELITEEKVEIKSSQFMVNKILSYQPLTALTAIELNKYIGRLPYWAVDSLFNTTVPKRKRRPYLYYPKREKLKEKKLRSKIRKVFCVNDFHAKQILEILRLKGHHPEKMFGLKEGE